MAGEIFPNYTRESVYATASTTDTITRGGNENSYKKFRKRRTAPHSFNKYTTYLTNGMPFTFFLIQLFFWFRNIAAGGEVTEEA